jgi:integrase/recombinase XerD
MPDKPINDLHRRMLADMTIRSFSDKTRQNYIYHIQVLSTFLGRSPDSATGDDLRRFQQRQVEEGARPPKLNSQASALRFLFTVTLGRPDLSHHLARAHYLRKLPRILSPEDVLSLLEAAPGPGLKYKAALSVAYGADLRCGEVVMLRIGDIDSERMLIPKWRWARRQRPLCHALSATAGVPARLVAAVPLARLAVSGP